MKKESTLKYFGTRITAYIFRYKENWATISFRYTLGYIAKTFVVAVCGRNITQQLFNGKKVELFC